MSFSPRSTQVFRDKGKQALKMKYFIMEIFYSTLLGTHSRRKQHNFEPLEDTNTINHTDSFNIKGGKHS